MDGKNDRWEIYIDKRDEFRWRRTSINGNVVGASCEGFRKKTDAKSNAQRHGMSGNPDHLGVKDRWEIFSDNKGDYRWKRMASNGEITGASSKGYLNMSEAEKNASRNGFENKTKSLP